MDKLRVGEYSGKMPFRQEDLKWMQDSYWHQINWMLLSFQNDSTNGFIISGCEVSEGGGQTTVSAGLVMFQGEIYYFPGESITASAVNVWFEREESYDPTGNKVFGDGVSHDVYWKRRVKLSTGTPTVPYVYVTGDRLIDRISDNLAQMSDWTTPSLSSGFSNLSMKYRKRFGIVEFRGTIHGGAGSIFTLPEGYRPAVNQEYLLKVYEHSSSFIIKKLTINTSGAVAITSNESGPDYDEVDIPMNFIMQTS